MTRALGKLPAEPDDRVIPLRLAMTTPEKPPPSCNWYGGGDWPMLANDAVGDCVPAAVLHCIGQRLGYANKIVRSFTDADALALYSQWTGYNPSDATTDRGTVMSTAMAAWAKDGVAVPDGVDTLTLYASVNHMSPDWVQAAIWHCGSVLLGLECPVAWLDSDYILDTPNGRGPVAGGHCVLLVGYQQTAIGTLYDTITWGARYRMTEQALLAVADEAYAPLDRDWLDAYGANPAGVDWAAAEAAMATIRHA